MADVLILLGLGVQKQVLRDSAPSSRLNRGEGAGALLVGVADAPQPGVVDVGVAHHGDIDFFLHRGQGFLDEATASLQEREKASRLTPLVSTKSQALAARFKMRGLSGLSSGRTLWASSRQESQ